MKNNDKHQSMPWLQTLSECRREDRDLPAHSMGELDGWSKRNKIDVQFASPSQTVFEITIRQAPKRPANPVARLRVAAEDNTPGDRNPGFTMKNILTVKDIFLTAGIMAVALAAAAGCNKNADTNNAPVTVVTNSVPATNPPPATNTDLMNTNLSTNHTVP